MGVDRRAFVPGMEKDQLLSLLEETLLGTTTTNNNDDDDDDYDDYDSDDVLQERQYEFSVASDLNRVLAGGLGVVNLGGALYLGNLLSSPALTGVRLPAYFGLVQSAYPWLLGYAVLYNLIPLGRKVWVDAQNEGIQRRNRRRRQWRTRVLSATVGRLANKLKQAKKMSETLKQKRLGSGGTGDNEVIFDTRKSAQDLEVKRERESMEEFDKLLGDSKFE